MQWQLVCLFMQIIYIVLPIQRPWPYEFQAKKIDLIQLATSARLTKKSLE